MLLDCTIEARESWRSLESGVAVLALGHYLSETTGPRALMELVGEKFGLEVEFIDLPTGL